VSIRQLLLLRFGEEEARGEADHVHDEADERGGQASFSSGEPGISSTSDVVASAAEVPIMRPPTFAAKPLARPAQVRR
jgi:hypothetical protein